jgi:hypothetical protein
LLLNGGSTALAFRGEKQRGVAMKSKFSSVVATFALSGFAVGIFCPTKQANAVAVDVLSYEYSGTGALNFQSNTTLTIGGVCSSSCGFITATMFITGTGPAFGVSPPSGWFANASSTVTDNLGDTMSVFVNAGDNFGPHHEISGSAFFASIMPSVLNISTSSNATAFAGPVTVDYTITISLPDGLVFTPLPAALPLFITGLGALGLLGWRRKRKAAATKGAATIAAA